MPQKELSEYNFTNYLKKVFEDDNRIEFQLQTETNRNCNVNYYKIIDGMYLQHWNEFRNNTENIDSDAYRGIIMSYYLKSGDFDVVGMTQKGKTDFSLHTGEVVRFAGNMQTIDNKYYEVDVESIGLYIYYHNLIESLKKLKMDTAAVEEFYKRMTSKGDPLIRADDVIYIGLVEDILKHIEQNNHFMVKVRSLELLYHTVSDYGQKIKKYRQEHIDKVKNIGKLIDTYPEDKYSIKAMAQECELSVAYFKQIFSYFFMTSPYQYVIEKRLEKGEELLLTTGLSVQEISENLSFSSPSKFIEGFKKIYGITPHRYRKSKIS